MRRVDGRRPEAREPLAEYYCRLLCEVFRRNDHGMQRICSLPVACDDTVTVEDQYLMKFLSWGMRMMMNIRYPRFTAIELWVLAISIIIAAGIQI
jgi:hypothetical protein